MIGFGIVIPILPFLSPKLGASDFDIAMIIASYALCAGVAGPWWGKLSDHIGRKPVLMICTSGAALAYLLLASAESLAMIYVARAFAGLMAGNFGVASAMMADITPPAERAKGMGMIGASFGLGLVLGPVLGGLLSGPDGSFFIPCLLAAVMSVLAVIAAWFFLPESHHRDKTQAHDSAVKKQSLWSVLRQTQSRLLMLQYIWHTSSVSAATYLFPLWVYALLDWNAREVGIVFGVQGAIMALTQGLLMGPLVKLLGELRLLRICVSSFFLGMLMTVFAQGAVAMVGSVLVALTGATLCMPVLNSFTSQRTAPQLRGRMMGAAGAAAAWGRVLGPLLAGLLLTVGGFRLAWSLPLAMVAMYWLWAFSRWPKRPVPDFD
ncbi:MFS transporter [Congregibacter variabilis]|uniref:MFS transporter n=1 Tax=Congregibacter variabilis TaxID=3081200 RepID=A0ABZ0I2I3_9GAMM|nr:MFS transporter [Congregibacter sp. IMCC43200]